MFVCQPWRYEKPGEFVILSWKQHIWEAMFQGEFVISGGVVSFYLCIKIWEAFVHSYVYLMRIFDISH